jgi:uncharacterized protein YbgA (DUF1722 family)
MRLIQLRFTRQGPDGCRHLVTAYEHGNPIYTAPLVEMADWLARHGFTYMPGSVAFWRAT